MSGPVEQLYDSQGEPLSPDEARTCARCGMVTDKTGPINYEPGPAYCGHWVCCDCQRGHGQACAACVEERLEATR